MCNQAPSRRSFMIPPRPARSMFEPASSSESENEEEYVFQEEVVFQVGGLIGGKRVMFSLCTCGVYKCAFCLSRFVASRLPK